MFSQVRNGPPFSPLSVFLFLKISLSSFIGTTHLLIGSSSTPNAVPSFLTTVLPQIAHSLLALDISANFLGALPPVLAICECLEELNVASNPLRVLPVFLADLLNLRVLIADSTGINTLPDALVDLDKLHTISIRRNKLHALPSWLCLLPALQTLCVDGNPFQGPWKALVDPLLAKVPTTPIYPPSTPMLPLSAGAQSSNADTETDGTTDGDDFSDRENPSPRQSGLYARHPEEEDQTITPERAPFLSRSTTSPLPMANNASPTNHGKPLTRTRTTPNRAYFDQTRSQTNQNQPSDPQGQPAMPSYKNVDGGEREVRKMKSAGDLRRGRSATNVAEESEMPRPPIIKYTTSLSSSNLLQMGTNGTPTNGHGDPSNLAEQFNKRFASVGQNSPYASPSRPPPNAARPMLSQSMWNSSPNTHNSPVAPSLTAPSVSTDDNSSSHSGSPMIQQPTEYNDLKSNRRTRPVREKSSRWGFLKKMSMGKMKPDPSSSTSSPSGSPNPPRISRPQTSSGSANSHSGSISRGTFDRLSKSPQIDVRLSTTNILDALSISAPSSPPPPNPPKLPSNEATGGSSLTIPSNSLLVPGGNPRTNKRRSFLPVEAPGTMSLSIPENSTFVSGVVISHDGEDTTSTSKQDPRLVNPSPVLDHEQYIRREQDRARDAYMRALRSVMAYLKDMNDLGTVQQMSNPLSMYGQPAQEDQGHTRPRRPTMVDSQREVSIASNSSVPMSLSDSTGHLRSSDSIAGIRSGTSSQTLSMASTTDSNGSSEERKFKDDKGKRAMVIKEIVL